MSNNAEKVFDFYLALPAETRMMIIDEMEPIDRCRFTRSSHLCEMEVRKSKNYIYSLELVVCSKVMRIGVRHGYEETYRDGVLYGFELIFDKEEYKGGKKYAKYTILNCQKLWDIELDSSTDMVQLFVDGFKLLLQAYQSIVRRVNITASMLETDKYINYDFGIKHMNNLEALEFGRGVGIGQFISKCRRPLKTVFSDENVVLADFEHICRVQETVYMTELKLNYEQFLQLSAKSLDINMGELTEMDVINFIKSWQNGTIRDSFHYCMWHVDRSRFFDFQEIVQFFELKSTDSGWEHFLIHHNKENDKKAEIYKWDDGIVFEDVSKRN